MSSFILVIFQLAVLIFSVMIHEISHGAVALKLGDPTAKNAGRLTLNPAKHLDPFGSFILPLLLFTLGGPVFGWAKPVPYNPFNLRDPKKGVGLIGVAGPLSNLFVAVVFGLLLRFLGGFQELGTINILMALVQFIILINVSLAVFNLLPIPPLDGASVLFAFLPSRFQNFQEFLSRYGFYILIFLLAVRGFNFIVPGIEFLYRIISGSSGL